MQYAARYTTLSGAGSLLDCAAMTYLKCYILGKVRHRNAEVCAVFVKLVFFSQLWRQLSRSYQGLEIAAFIAQCHIDIEQNLVTGANECRQHCMMGEFTDY